MKDIYVVLAFHAHELLWDLPRTFLSYLEPDNPMRQSLLDENYLKKRKEEGRDIYTLCSQMGDHLDAPLCVEYTNELLVQIREVLPPVFDQLKKDYRRGRLYPLYGHAHHTHVSLLEPDEMAQEITWNKEYLHHAMDVPYPKYRGLFPTEASLSQNKLGGIEQANIDYVIFPHLEEGKIPYRVKGEGDYVYRPFWIEGPRKNILAFPRNFAISQEIWRPITKMKRDEVKAQGYMLGDFPVFDTEYLTGKAETYPIDFDQGVAMYQRVLRAELEKAPDQAVLVYIQDLELMDFGDIALEIMAKAWQSIRQEDAGRYRVHFVTPDTYIDQVLAPQGLNDLPVVYFDKISWAPEIRLILRADGHYPPLGVNRVGDYDLAKTGVYSNPHVFWESGKYYCRIFDTLLKNFAITPDVPVDVEELGLTGYDLARQSQDTRAVLYLRLMKRACNWGWRPTEGRQKRPFLNGFLLCSLLEKRLEEQPAAALKREILKIDDRNLVGLAETLKVFIDSRVNYLKYGLDQYTAEHGRHFDQAGELFSRIDRQKEKALEQVAELYRLNRRDEPGPAQLLAALKAYSQAVFLATDLIQRVWGEGPDADYLVEKMYQFLYKQYPPLFPSLLERIDSMNEQAIEQYFAPLALKA